MPYQRFCLPVDLPLTLHAWDITETEANLSAECANHSTTPIELPKHSLARLQTLAKTCLLYQIFGKNIPQNNPQGAPYVLDTQAYVSISHSENWVLLAQSGKKIGVDIQKIVAKIANIAPKFLSNQENKHLQNLPPALRLDFCACIWTLKEAGFKYYQLGNLPFSEGIETEGLEHWQADFYTSKGWSGALTIRTKTEIFTPSAFSWRINGNFCVGLVLSS
jgi:4'-phosphopantetheinyl transferase